MITLYCNVMYKEILARTWCSMSSPCVGGNIENQIDSELEVMKLLVSLR